MTLEEMLTARKQIKAQLDELETRIRNEVHRLNDEIGGLFPDANAGSKTREAPTRPYRRGGRQKVLDAFSASDKPMRNRDVREATGLMKSAISEAIYHFASIGKLRPVETGLYEYVR